MPRVLTEKDYRVMSKLLDRKNNKGLSKLTGLTRKELEVSCNVSYTKVKDALNSLIEYGFVDFGIAKGREKTYYLTQDGLNELREITKNVVKIKEESDNE
ncbi:hypothetical protein AB2T90_17095 [Clostridium butyricum]|uniref:hypothetical protein n=1 Tax=Clostridium butyricum TaxID=1492 RepID=UPI003467389D